MNAYSSMMAFTLEVSGLRDVDLPLKTSNPKNDMSYNPRCHRKCKRLHSSVIWVLFFL